MQKYLIIPLIFFSLQVFGQEIKLNEKLIEDIVKSGSPPTLQEIESSLLNTKSNLSQFNDQFKVFGTTGGSYTKTNEEPLISFQPIFSPQSEFSIGAQKSFQSGFQVSSAVGAFKNDYTLLGVDSTGTVSNISVAATIDLWKNLFGKLSKARGETLALSLQSAKLQKSVQTQVFLNRVRGLYWQLVGNEESLKISEALLESAKRQVKDAVNRYKNSVADKGEVARYRAQVATRESQRTSLLFQRQQILMALRQLLPEFQGKKVILGDVNLNQATQSVLQCVGMIQSKVETPIQYSLYDDLNELLKSIRKQQTKVAEGYSKPEVTLKTQFKTSAVDESTMDAFDESINEDRRGFSVGLQVNVPIGFQDTKKQLVKVEELKADYQIKEREAILNSQHAFIKESIGYLLSAIQSQGVSKDNLEIRVADVKKKYKQGRISVTEFITDQDNLLQTELQIVETKLLVVKTLLDYFSIFTHTPCAFNRIVL